MNETNNEKSPADNMEALKQEAAACGSGCACHGATPSGKGRWVAGALILVVAGVLVARGVTKNDRAASKPASTGFAALPAPEKPSAPAVAAALSDTDAVKELAALSDLNNVAADTVGVFVFLPGTNGATAQAPTAQIRSAVRTMEPQLRGGKVGIFTLKISSPDYEQVASKMTVPGVLAMVKGAGMSATSGDITESKLVQAYVAASRAGGCGPSGCGPSGCN